jgi:hypothetical protein
VAWSGTFEIPAARASVATRVLGLVGGIVLGVVVAQAQTPVIGRVIDVGPDSVLIQPEGVETPPVRLPLASDTDAPNLSAGARVRLWAEADVGEGPAWRLVPQSGVSRGGLDRDRTGVRSRIGRGLGQGAFGGGHGGGGPRGR